MLGGDGFRVELHAVNGQLFVLQPHDGAVLEMRCDLQTVRQALAFDHQRMIAGGSKGRGQPLEQTLVGVVHLAHLAMHDLVAAHHLAAEGLTDGLMPKANAQQGRAGFSGGLGQGKANAGLIGVARARAQQDAGRLHRHGLLHIQRIVSPDLDLGAEFAQIMHEVVGEGVVVVD